MNRLKRNRGRMLLAMVLVAILVGVGGAETGVGAPGPNSRQFVLSAAYFYPISHTYKYANNGSSLVSSDTSAVKFMAPVQFLAPYYATVERVQLFAYDNANPGRIQMWLEGTKPATTAYWTMAHIDTGVQFKSPTKPRVWQDSSINHPTVSAGESAYLVVEIEPFANLEFLGVRVWYHPGR